MAEGSSCGELLCEFNSSGDNLKPHPQLAIRLFAIFPFSSKWGGWEITEVGEPELGLEETCSARGFAAGVGKGLDPKAHQDKKVNRKQASNSSLIYPISGTKRKRWI